MVKVKEDMTGWVMAEHGVPDSRLTVICRVEDYIDPSGRHKPRWLCQCECGSDPIVINQDRLRDNMHGTKSCGCLSREATIKRNIQMAKHGLSGTRLYKIWKCMHMRCYNQNDEHYKDYGGRGIIICEVWKNNYINFYEWAINNGYNDNLTIDRIDVNGNYEPDNCRWTTVQAQQNNKRSNVFLTYNGETHTIMEWANILGVDKYNKLYWRYSQGWSVEDILKNEVKQNGY